MTAASGADRHQPGSCLITAPGLCENAAHDHTTWPPMHPTSGADHPSHPDQLMAQTLGVCWHPRGTPSFWPCTPLADWEIEWAEQQSTSGADQPTLRDQLADVAHRAIQEASWERGVAMLDTDVAAFRTRLLADLLPLIEADRERAKAEGGAEALEQAAERADTWARLSAPGDAERAYEHVHSYLRARARATALRGSTGGGQ